MLVQRIYFIPSLPKVTISIKGLSRTPARQGDWENAISGAPARNTFSRLTTQERIEGNYLTVTNTSNSNIITMSFDLNDGPLT